MLNPLFENGGVTGELMNSFPWEKTSLGKVENWPQNLRTCIRIILTSSQPMFVWWGKDLINLYNDKYISIVGGKHPKALGQPAKVVWKEIWDQVGPRVNKVLTENIGTYDESLLLIMERNGYAEETYYTFSYSPISGEDGKTEGIICANTDDTEKIVGERQLRTLKDIGKAIIDLQNLNTLYKKTIEVLTQNPQDFPFVLFYSVDSKTNIASLEGLSDLNIDSTIAPTEINLSTEDSIWPLYKLKSSNDTLIVKSESLGDINLPKGFWDIAPSNILLLPISHSNLSAPYGYLIVGLNPYRLIDEKYISFFRLVSDQIATSIRNVQIIEEERNRAESLAALDKAKTTFFSNVSHEFRTPLTLMLGPLQELIENSEVTSEHGLNNLTSAYRNSKRLLKLVNTLLDFSKIEAGREHAQFHPVELSEFTSELVRGFDYLMEKANLKFIVNCEPLSEPIYIDPNLWEKIVLNLLSNAFKFTLSGSITVSLHEQGKEVLFSVKDTGVGIPAKELPRMFDRFHRIENSGGRTYEGTGIGLSLVNELVKLHKGEIEIKSEEGKGSEFIIHLKKGNKHLNSKHIDEERIDNLNGENFNNSDIFINEAERWISNTESQNQEEIPLVAEDINATGKRKKDVIMIADDNVDMREYITRFLSGHYSVVQVTNGKEALNYLNENEPPTLILSDVMMPVIDGFELLKKVKSNPKTMAIPFILLSARAGEEATIEGLEAGADDYLVKPFSSKELVSRINSVIKLADIRKKTEKKFENLFENAPLGVALLKGENFVIELANYPMLEIWGRTKNIIGKTVWEVFPEIMDQVYPELLKSVYLNGTPFSAEESQLFLERNGKNEELYVNFVYEPIPEENNLISGVLALAYDVTESVQNRKKIEESEEYFRRLADGLPTTIFLSDINGNWVYVNDYWYKQFPEHVDWANNYWLNIIPENERAKMGNNLIEAAKNKTPFNFECRIAHDENNEKWINFIGTPRYNKLNEFEGHIGILFDVTDKKQQTLILEEKVAERTVSLLNSNEKLRILNEELLKKNEDLEQFAYVASHDLKEPIRMVYAYTQLMLRNLPQENKKIRDYSYFIQEGVERIQKLISDLLEYSRIGQSFAEKREISIKAIVNKAIDRLEPIIKESEAQIKVGELPTIKVVPSLILQLFQNLIENSIKFAKPGVAPVIDIQAKEVDANEWIFSVSDNGIGIRKQYEKKIFVIFQRLNNRDNFSGSGIGLSIAKRIVEYHGGKIWLDSVEGEGTSFYFNLKNEVKQLADVTEIENFN